MALVLAVGMANSSVLCWAKPVAVYSAARVTGPGVVQLMPQPQVATPKPTATIPAGYHPLPPVLEHALRQQLHPFLQSNDALTLSTFSQNPLLPQVDATWTLTTSLGAYWSPRFVVTATQGNHRVCLPVLAEVRRTVYVANAAIASGQRAW
jgi:hypothetical protein